MYHLGISEASVAKKVILTPDPMDVPFYALFLEHAEKVGDNREYVTYTGSYRGEPISIMSCGFGCMPMAIAVEELHHLGVEEIVKIDFCPAIGEEIAPNAICAALGAVRGEFASREYVDTSYPAASDMELLSRLIKGGLKRTALFRSHDLLSMETPATEAGRRKLAMWAELGVEVMDRETASMLVIASILKVKAASLAMISENYTTGRKAEQGEAQRRALFETAARALTMA
jgi:uridine phosphorylase